MNIRHCCGTIDLEPHRAGCPAAAGHADDSPSEVQENILRWMEKEIKNVAGRIQELEKTGLIYSDSDSD